MRKLSLLLASAAGLALIAGTAATPALAQIRLGIDLGPPTYYRPYNGYNNGYNSRPYYDPYYGTYPNQGYNTYPYPSYNPYYGRYDRYNYPGYYGR